MNSWNCESLELTIKSNRKYDNIIIIKSFYKQLIYLYFIILLDVKILC